MEWLCRFHCLHHLAVVSAVHWLHVQRTANGNVLLTRLLETHTGNIRVFRCFDLRKRCYAFVRKRTAVTAVLSFVSVKPYSCSASDTPGLVISGIYEQVVLRWGQQILRVAAYGTYCSI